MKNVAKLLYVILCIFFSGCSDSQQVSSVDLTKKINLESGIETVKNEKIRIAVGGMITPRAGFKYYRRLLDYIGAKMDMQVEFVDREDYGEINRLLRDEAIDGAFVCGGPYVEGNREFGMELLAAPYAHGGTVYYSYIIVHSESSIEQFDDLRGRSFAFTDPMSNTGKLVPTYMLAQRSEKPESFFSKVEYTYAHDKSIKAVAEGFVDGAAVDSLIWEYAHRKESEFAAKTKVIRTSPPYGIPPFVVRKGLDADLKQDLQDLFLKIHEDTEGAEILRGMMVERFVMIDDNAYDSIREMKGWMSSTKDNDV